uniref:Uncharacterized protein n=1 Tax=Heterorhabditis bacteriophora TaxID=37862 RepID=A0A1I7WLX4_HETBA
MSRAVFEQFTAQPPQPAGEFVVQQQSGHNGDSNSSQQNHKIFEVFLLIVNIFLVFVIFILKSWNFKGQELTIPQVSPPVVSTAPATQITAVQLNQLRAQVNVYKLLARNEPVPPALAAEAVVLKPKSTTLLPEPYEFPGEGDDGEKLPYDLMKILSIHQHRCARPTSLPTPVGIDPMSLLKESEHRYLIRKKFNIEKFVIVNITSKKFRIQNRIGLRIQELSNLPADMPPNLRIKAEIELRALRLVNLQAQVRSEIMGALRRDTTLETALNPYAYRRTKRQSLREARVTEKLEKQQKMEQERKRRQKHTDLMQAIIQHGREFKDYHRFEFFIVTLVILLNFTTLYLRNNLLKTQKVKKAVITYHQNNERERKKDEIKNEKLRMQKLMQEDEEGYRALLDEKKSGNIKQLRKEEKKKKKRWLFHVISCQMTLILKMRFILGRPMITGDDFLDIIINNTIHLIIIFRTKRFQFEQFIGQNYFQIICMYHSVFCHYHILV